MQSVRQPKVYKRRQHASNGAYDQDESPVKRPPYVHQVPLQLIPGIGPKTIQKLKEAFGTEMNILHRVNKGDLKETIRPQWQSS